MAEIRSVRRRNWYRKYDSSKSWRKKKEEQQQSEEKVQDSNTNAVNVTEAPTDRTHCNVHSALICGMTRIDRPYFHIRRYLREEYGLIPIDIELNRDRYGYRTGTAAIHFPFRQNIDRLFEKSHHYVHKKVQCKISPLQTERVSSTTNNPIMNKNIGSTQHRDTCILRRLTNDSWYLIIRHLHIIDLFRFQLVCSCAKNITNLYFHKKRTEFKFDYNEVVSNLYKLDPDGVCKTFPMLLSYRLNYNNVMNIVMRHNLSKVISLTIDMQAAVRMELESNFFQLIKKHCPKLRHLKVINSLISTWKSAPRLQISLDTLELTNDKIYCNSRMPILSEEAAQSFFTCFKKLRKLVLRKWSPEQSIFKYIPQFLTDLTLTGHFNEMPTEEIANHLFYLQSFTLKVCSRGMSMGMTHHHFLKFDILEELNLNRYPIYYDRQWILPDAMRVAYFVPSLVKKLTLSHMGLEAADLNMITTYCPHIEYLKLKELPGDLEGVDFQSLSVLAKLVIDNVGSTFPIIVDNLPLSIQHITLRHGLACAPEILRLIFYVHQTLLNIKILEMGFDVYLMSEDVLFCPDKTDSDFAVFMYDTDTRVDEIRYSSRYTIEQERENDTTRRWTLATDAISNRY